MDIGDIQLVLFTIIILLIVMGGLAMNIQDGKLGIITLLFMVLVVGIACFLGSQDH